MLEVGICDDEKVLRRDLRKIIEQTLDLCGIEYHIQEYHSGEELLYQFSLTPCNILFLDIEMNGVDGMTVAKQLRKKDTSYQLIFVTSHPDFVFQGYEVSALNYILKPYKREKINKILQIALERLNLETEQFYLIEQRGRSLRLSLNKVKYFLSERRYIHAITDTEKHTFYGKLEEVESQLPDHFVRIHNRYLVNLKYIEAIEGNFIRCEEEFLPISRSYKQDLSITFAKYMLQ